MSANEECREKLAEAERRAREFARNQECAVADWLAEKSKREIAEGERDRAASTEIKVRHERDGLRKVLREVRDEIKRLHDCGDKTREETDIALLGIFDRADAGVKET